MLALVDRSKAEQFVRLVGRPVLICSTADGAFVK
jgi:hypothetical protein